MRVLAGILGVTFIVVTSIAIAMGEFKGSFIFAFLIGPAFIAYAWGGQKLLEKHFPSLAESTRKKKKPKDPTS